MICVGLKGKKNETKMERDAKKSNSHFVTRVSERQVLSHVSIDRLQLLPLNLSTPNMQ